MSESASGEANSGSGASDKDPSVCPTCNKQLKSRKGVYQHHKRSHGEALRKTVKCDNCDSAIEVIPAKVDSTRFCDMECKAEYQSKHHTGENAINWQGGKVDLECDTCGTEIKKKPSHVGENNFCSIGCHREYQSIHQRGENHHNYQGGRTTEYGPNWQAQRRKAIERDEGVCQDCGTHRDELDRDIHVHHIIPRERFIDGGELDHQEANDLSNLICLCVSCHGKWEGLYLRPDTRG